MRSLSFVSHAVIAACFACPAYAEYGAPDDAVYTQDEQERDRKAAQQAATAAQNAQVTPAPATIGAAPGASTIYALPPAPSYRPETIGQTIAEPMAPQPQAIPLGTALQPLVTAPAPQAAPAPGQYIPLSLPSFVEGGLLFHDVTNNQGDWFGQFIGGQYQSDSWNRWSAQIQHQQAFKDEGTGFSLANTHQFDEDWFSDVGVGYGTDAVFLNRYSLNAALNRRWLEQRNLITTVGVNYNRAQRIYDNTGLLLGATYYFPAPWVVQGSVLLSRSNPGSVFSPSGTVAVTHGYYGNYFITGRVGLAREAYQLLGGNAVVNKFDSYALGLNWRHWVGQDWGFNIGSEFYHNPIYERTGGTFSLFKEFDSQTLFNDLTNLEP